MAYATSYIFQRRARWLKQRTQWIKFAGFVVPMIVGLLVLAYAHLKLLPVIIAIAAGMGLLQVAVLLWTTVAGWDDKISYSAASATANDQLAAKYAELAQSPPRDIAEFQHQHELLKAEDRSRIEQDMQQGVNESEKRMGMRAGLRKYQRKCAGCDSVPVTMQADECGVCGNFRYRL